MSSIRTSIAEPYAFPRMESSMSCGATRTARARRSSRPPSTMPSQGASRKASHAAARKLRPTRMRSSSARVARVWSWGAPKVSSRCARRPPRCARHWRNSTSSAHQIVAEAEAFCVDVALAIVARLVATNSARTEFVVSSVQSALKTLAPENPTAVYLHPTVRKRVARAMNGLPLNDDENLASGSARVEAGRLLVQSSIDEAFERIRSAILELKAKRQAAVADAASGGIDASDQ